MKKFISLTGYSLIIAAQFSSAQAFAKEVTSYDINGIHTRESYPLQTADSNLLLLSGDPKQFYPADVACVKKQIAEIKKIASGLDIDKVEINLEYGNRIHKGNYAKVKMEKPYKIPILNVRVGEEKVLEVGVTMPFMPNGRNSSSCVIVAKSALKKAVDEAGTNISEGAMLIMQHGVVDLNERSAQRQSLNAWLECGIDLGANQPLNEMQKKCLSKVDSTNEAAIYTQIGDKVRIPAGYPGEESSSGSSRNSNSSAE